MQDKPWEAISLQLKLIFPFFFFLPIPLLIILTDGSKTPRSCSFLCLEFAALRDDIGRIDVVWSSGEVCVIYEAQNYVQLRFHSALVPQHQSLGQKDSGASTEVFGAAPVLQVLTQAEWKITDIISNALCLLKAVTCSVVLTRNETWLLISRGHRWTQQLLSMGMQI